MTGSKTKTKSLAANKIIHNIVYLFRTLLITEKMLNYITSCVTAFNLIDQHAGFPSET